MVSDQPVALSSRDSSGQRCHARAVLVLGQSSRSARRAFPERSALVPSRRPGGAMLTAMKPVLEWLPAAALLAGGTCIWWRPVVTTSAAMVVPHGDRSAEHFGQADPGAADPAGDAGHAGPCFLLVINALDVLGRQRDAFADLFSGQRLPARAAGLVDLFGAGHRHRLSAARPVPKKS